MGELELSAPTLVSLIICDQVIDDKLTNKKSAIGLFNAVLVPQAPTALSQLVVLASLTEIVGRATIELRMVRDADNSTIFSTKGVVEAPSPLATVDLVFRLQGVTLPATGQYAFELYGAGEPLGRRRFHVYSRAAGGNFPLEAPGPNE